VRPEPKSMLVKPVALPHKSILNLIARSPVLFGSSPSHLKVVADDNFR